MRNSILFLFLLLSHSAKSQYWIAGKTVDKNDSIITSVPIKIDNNLFYSNKKGAFLIRTAQPNVTLHFSHLGYELKSQDFTNLIINDTLFVTVTLQPDERIFDPVLINSELIQTVYAKQNTSIIDFNFHKENIFFILKEKRDYYLRIMDQSYTVIQQKKLPFKPEELVLDCFSNMHILSADSSYQVTYPTLALLPYSIKEFNTFLLPCKAAFDSLLYVQSYSNYNQSLCYYKVNRENFKKEEIVCITDKELAAGALYYDNKIKNSTAPSIMAEIYPGVPGRNSEMAKDLLEDIFFFEIEMNKEIYHPIIKCNDSLYLFNHQQNKTIVYDKQGNYTRSFSINYPLEFEWKKPLLYDVVQNKLYLITTTINHDYFIHELSLENGQLLNSYPIHYNFMTSKQMKVWNGHIYFLYRLSPTQGFWKLFKHKL